MGRALGFEPSGSWLLSVSTLLPPCPPAWSWRPSCRPDGWHLWSPQGGAGSRWAFFPRGPRPTPPSFTPFLTLSVQGVPAPILGAGEAKVTQTDKNPRPYDACTTGGRERHKERRARRYSVCKREGGREEGWEMQVRGGVGGKEAGEQPGGHGPPHPRFSCRGFKIYHVLPLFLFHFSWHLGWIVHALKFGYSKFHDLVSWSPTRSHSSSLGKLYLCLSPALWPCCWARGRITNAVASNATSLVNRFHTRAPLVSFMAAGLWEDGSQYLC